MSKQFDYNPKQSMSPAQQHYATELDNTRQKKMQMDESSLVSNVLKGVSQLGEDASLENVLQGIYGKGLSPQSEQNLSKQLGEHYSKKEIEKSKKKQESQQSVLSALEQVQRGREILKSGHAGPVASLTGTSRNWGSTFSGEGQRLRSELSAIKAGLVQALAPLKITNRPEFEHFSKLLEDPDLTKEQLEGVFDYLEQKLKSSIPSESKQGEGSNIPGSPEGWRGQNEKPQGDSIRVRHKDTGQPYNIPRDKYQPHPDLIEEMNQ